MELGKYKGGADKLEPGDFTEEWVLFISEDEYDKDDVLRQQVDFRLKGKMDITEFLHRPKPFSCFADFVDAIIKR